MKNRYLVYLLYFLLVALVTTVVSFSRYKTTVTAWGNVSVAKPVLECVPICAILDGEPLTELDEGIDVSGVMPGAVLQYTFEIRNYTGTEPNVEKTEVSMKYKISPSLEPAPPALNLPLTIDLVPEDTYPDAGEGWISISFGGEIVHRYTMTVTWPEEETDSGLKNQQQKIVLRIKSEQVD